MSRQTLPSGEPEPPPRQEEESAVQTPWLRLEAGPQKGRVHGIPQKDVRRTEDQESEHRLRVVPAKEQTHTDRRAHGTDLGAPT